MRTLHTQSHVHVCATPQKSSRTPLNTHHIVWVCMSETSRFFLYCLTVIILVYTVLSHTHRRQFIYSKFIKTNMNQITNYFVVSQIIIFIRRAHIKSKIDWFHFQPIQCVWLGHGKKNFFLCRQRRNEMWRNKIKIEIFFYLWYHCHHLSCVHRQWFRHGLHIRLKHC